MDIINFITFILQVDMSIFKYKTKKKLINKFIYYFTTMTRKS